MIQTIFLFLKGMAMGAADVVPGVSGGTIALVAGIYDRLINAIKSVGLDTLKALKNGGIAAAWRQIDGNFLLVLLAGILSSVVLLASLIHHLLDTQPILVWSFFFGLVLASALYVGTQIPSWQKNHWFWLVVGTACAAWISSMAPTSIAVTPLSLFGAGALAICAMILPGISGSFILLMIGMYTPVIAAIKGLDFANLGIFAGGCVVGILAFSRVLSWLLSRYHHAMLALLTGFMLGALVKIWPWKLVVSYTVSSSGAQKPLVEKLLWPTDYVLRDPQIIEAAVCALAGAGAVFVLERLGKLFR